MKKNVKKHTDGVWYYAVVRWDGYGVFTSWDRAREECDGYSDNKKKKFKTFEEAKAYAEDEYRKLHGVESSCYVEEIGWLDYFYRRMMKKRSCGTDGNKDKTVYTLESLNQLMMTMA